MFWRSRRKWLHKWGARKRKNDKGRVPWHQMVVVHLHGNDLLACTAKRNQRDRQVNETT